MAFVIALLDESVELAKIVIVDDHPVTRDGLMMRLVLEEDLTVCGEAADIKDALALVASAQPDLAVVDVSLETGCGIDLVKELKSRFPNLRMLVWSMYDESLYAERAIQAGALGYINKKHAREEIVNAVRTVLAGDIYLSAEYSTKILNRLRAGKSIVSTAPDELLSDRELEAFTLIGHGLKTADVAKRMDLTTKTIETYRARIKAKLELAHSGELSHVAVRWVVENS